MYAESDEGDLIRTEAIVDAETRKKAAVKGFRMFPEYHEIGVYEMEEKTNEEMANCSICRTR
jgi:hypothetical protein